MAWFYSKRGDAGRHGQVTEAALMDMAKNGELAPDDLVYEDTVTNAWFRASRINGLFPKPAQNSPSDKPVTAPATGEKRPWWKAW